MTPDQFLQTILPAEGFYCLALPYKQGFRHKICNDTSSMLVEAMGLDQRGYDVYYTIASLKNERVWDARKNNGQGGWRTRTKDNIHSLACVFFEADVLRPAELENATEDVLQRKYSSRAEALTGVRDFCANIGWPEPLVVSSGWGYHFYWPLTEPVQPSSYEVLVRKLKLAAVHFGFKLDTSAADISRVFRVPGTHNHKDPNNPQPVQILRGTDSVDFEQLASSLDSVLAGKKIPTKHIQERTQLPNYLNFGDNNLIDYPDEPLKYDPIAKKCGAIQEVVDNDANVPYHHWYRALQVLRHCEDGRNLCHEISSAGDTYDQGTTDKMLDTLEAKEIPPTLCERMAENTSACSTCPYWGKIRTPAALGRDLKSYKQNMNMALQAATGSIPPAPWPFKCGPKGVFVEREDNNGNTYDYEIFPYELAPVRRLFSERDERELTLWKTSNPADGFVEVEIPSATLYDKKSCAQTLADVGIYTDLERVDWLRKYMVSYIQEVQRVFKKEYLYSRLGWRDNGAFVYQNKLFTSSGIYRCQVEQNTRVMESITSAGDLENWKQILQYFSGHEFAAHQFAIGVGFAAPLMKMTGQSGGIVNIMGFSGEGKSTVQKVVNSIWGHPKDLMLPAETKSSTYNAKISFINSMNNLPICAEEITNATIEELGSLAYAITQGSEKWRADVRGNVRNSTGGWCTIMLASANNSLHEKLHEGSGASAKMLRIFEYQIPHVRRHTKADFQAGVDIALMDNYGLAGEAFLTYLTQNPDAVRERLRERMRELDNALEIRPEERIWSAVIACTIVGLEISGDLGLHPFSINDVIEFVRSTLAQLRLAIGDVSQPPTEILANFLNEHIDSTLVVEETGSGRSAVVYELRSPKNNLDVRYEVNSELIYVSASALRKWCLKNNIAYTHLTESLRQVNVIQNTTRKCLAKGTQISAGQVRAWTVDASTPTFSGGVQAVAQNIKSNIKSGAK